VFSIGGCVLGRLREEMADPTLRERKLSPKNPSHTFTDADKERLKQHILTWNPQLEDGFIVVKRDFLPTRDETLGKLQNIMEARGFRAMSYSGFMQYVHFFNPYTKANPPAELADSESDEDLTSSQKRERKKKAPRHNNEL